MAARNVIIGALIGLAASGIAISGAGTASADGLTCQSGCTIDYDGTQGSYDSDGTRGTSRNLTTQSTAGHTIQSDACYVKASSTYCPPPSSFNPEIISATSGVSDDPDSALDPDGFQAAAVR